MEPDEKLEQPTETCGLMVTFERGMAMQVNLKSTRQKVIEKIQNHLAKGLVNLVQFETANPDEQEVCMINPSKIIIAMVKKEFIISSGKLVKASMGSPGAPPTNFRH